MKKTYNDWKLKITHEFNIKYSNNNQSAQRSLLSQLTTIPGDVPSSVAASIFTQPIQNETPENYIQRNNIELTELHRKFIDPENSTHKICIRQYPADTQILASLCYAFEPVRQLFDEPTTETYRILLNNCTSS